MFQKVKGFQDIYGEDCVYWQKAEKKVHRLFSLFSVREIRLPVVERTAVFDRGIGQTTDIVEKEMFTMPDGENDTLSLRPEGTAGVVRAYIENGLYNPPALKRYYYLGPMFRRENPQKGRFRQFTQSGVEYLGSASAFVDADVINLLMSYFETVGIADMLHLEINSVGCKVCRPAYQKKLITYFEAHKDALCEDCLRRLERNPLRILDCKQEKCRTVTKNAPLMLDNLCEECGTHFNNVQKYLKQFKVEYKINPLMVRGLDYYVRTAFEAVTDKLGAASAVGAGGRYDGLVETLGGPEIPGIGFAIGMDRVVTLMKEKEKLAESGAQVYIITFDDKSVEEGIKLLNGMRERGIAAEIDYDRKGLKNQMKKADRSGAKYALILGEDELSRNALTVRYLQDSTQVEMPLDKIFTDLQFK